MLTVHLLHEVSKKEASFWYPYICQLPRKHSTLAHFDDKDAEAFQVRVFHKYVSRMQVILCGHPTDT